MIDLYLWQVALLVLIGMAIGGGAAWVITAARKRGSGEEVHQLREQLAGYKRDVEAHFVESAQQVAALRTALELTASQLASGAESLCGPGTAERLRLQQAPATADTRAQSLEPPRDYAPKTDPQAKGMLAEDFGLDNGR
ncbi:MAG: DUF1043 family protein [Pseudomonadota bacterium]|nr:DUF1043 family protein [Pseudomonadota bacterium]